MAYCRVQLGGSAGPCLASTLYSGVENTEDMASLDEVFIRLTGTAYAGMHLPRGTGCSSMFLSFLRSWIRHGK